MTKRKLGEWRGDKSALIKIDISAKKNRIKNGGGVRKFAI